jgi:hypothetical protein
MTKTIVSNISKPISRIRANRSLKNAIKVLKKPHKQVTIAQEKIEEIGGTEKNNFYP